MGNSTIKISLLLIFTNVTVLVKQKEIKQDWNTLNHT